MEWTLAEAKNRFSEVVKRALSEGPQRVGRRGDDAVVIVAQDEYDRLTGARPDFKKLLFEGPDFDELDLNRDRTPPRDTAW
jgi:prevent-host-death family protein